MEEFKFTANELKFDDYCETIDKFLNKPVIE
jgi:hypothetical protein